MKLAKKLLNYFQRTKMPTFVRLTDYKNSEEKEKGF